MSVLKTISSSIRKVLSDNFASRANTTGSLGIATDGSTWNPVNGTITVTSGAATASSTPAVGAAGTAYPMVTATLPVQDNIIELKGTQQGSSVAVWVQSSSDWWMVDVDSTYNAIPGNWNYAYSQNAYTYVGGYTNAYFYASQPAYAPTTTSVTNYVTNTYSFTNSYTAPPNAYTPSPTSYTSPPTSYTAYGTNAWNYNYSYAQGNSGYSYANKSSYFHYVTAYANGVQWGNSTYTAPGTTNYASSPTSYSPGGTYYVNAANYGTSPGNTYYVYTGNYYNYTQYYYAGGTQNTTGGNYYTYQASQNATTYAYSEILRITQSVASSVSTITSSIISTAQTIGSLRVKTKGNQITAQAFSDANLVTQIGTDLVYTATGATVTTKYGLAISPSAYQQSAIIGTAVNITRN